MAGGFYVATVHDTAFAGECWDSDARLIAAAPCLLEALTEFVTEYAGFEDGNGNACPTLAKARAAIAKARGEVK